MDRIKTGLRLREKYRILLAHWNLQRFRFKNAISFELANQFITRVDKQSLELILRKNGAEIGENCDIETGLTFHNCKDYSNLIIGNHCHIGKNCFFDLREKIRIGNHVVISMKTTLITHIDMTRSKLSEYYPAKSNGIIIEDHCYVGVGSTILMGVTLGKSSFVAARSLVISDAPPETMIGGIPAKRIKEINGTQKVS